MTESSSNVNKPKVDSLKYSEHTTFLQNQSCTRVVIIIILFLVVISIISSAACGCTKILVFVSFVSLIVYCDYHSVKTNEFQ